MNPVRFDAAWCATDLGEYRDCRYTYERYPYANLPPLHSSQFTGAFQWLDGVRGYDPERVAELDDLAGDLAARAFPYRRTSSLSRPARTCTARWTRSR